ncbi:decarboxylating 6-phosphogluconate dehydrogenase [Enterococcus asini]|uniref:phosphogluconate dehydrogenase (NAD(+)-dependent, decarboxylating) n=1 Tax=Enterococcus asini TaxID=57732 RepID=UPI00289240A0|nr:decarboxylating 6-phosphogluconate dehydrogenase [Enterococcus asini]MDT2757372.1 decarboxylating 6-phosphogluconate dehydrogenase [Enterococcus asini]
MEIGLIGLGKMGLNLALNGTDHGFTIKGFDISPEVRQRANESGIKTAESLEQLVESLSEPKTVMISAPAGKITNDLIAQLKELLPAESIVIDAGNANYHESKKNFASLKEKNIHFLDCGTSGGMEGARHGACLMIGGEAEVFEKVAPFFKAIATEDGCLYGGKPGAGHYLKMVHNGIEYGMMQAIGEGFDILEASPEYQFDNEAVAKVWNHGSVVRSWLMELLQEGFAQDPNLEKIKGEIQASGEAKWTVEEALKLGVPVPIIANSLFVRNTSQIEDSFSNKVVATLRHGFGGHAVKQKGE